MVSHEGEYGSQPSRGEREMKEAKRMEEKKFDRLLNNRFGANAKRMVDTGPHAPSGEVNCEETDHNGGLCKATSRDRITIHCLPID